MKIAKVIIGQNRPEIDRCFDYRVPEGMASSIAAGTRVIVPFGGRNAKTEGCVLSLAEDTAVSAERLKDIAEVLDEGRPAFTPQLLALAQWMRERYFCTLNQCLQAILPAGIRSRSSWIVRAKQTSDAAGLTPKERAVLQFLADGETHPLEEIEGEFRGNMMEYLRKMQDKGLLELRQELHHSNYRRERRYYSLDLAHPQLEAVWAKAAKEKRLEGQRLLLDALRNGEEKTAEELKEALGISDSPIQTLRKKGILIEHIRTERRSVVDVQRIEPMQPLPPTAEQASALVAIRAERQKDEKRPILLHGVTGSGKTEVYLQIIADVLREGRQAIVLVPEISLTPLLVERFAARFGDVVSVTHSHLSMGERVDQWKRARDGEISVMIGPRSALFTPFRNIGAIIMDEAHENSYFSDITPKYDTKEVAEEAARLCGALFLMGTATPDFTSYHKAMTGQYLLLELRERTGGGALPEVSVVDLRRELQDGNRSPFSRALRGAIREALARGEQAMLFLNRRGTATFVSCRSCGTAMTCPHCDIAYTYHGREHALVCHYCGRRAAVPQVCPACGSKYIRYFGTGTQKIEEEARRLFPQARILRMDLDTTGTKHSHERILETFGRGEADILIGTQMIAKGHDFPRVTVVGIMAADALLFAGSYTAAETGFRLMLQVAGRAGRAELPGHVFLQTYQPKHYAVRYAAAHDFKGFYAEESVLRRMMGYPPFAALLGILLVGEEKEAVAAEAEELAAALEKRNTSQAVSIFGPTPAALARFRGEYRYQILLKAENEQILRELLLPELASRGQNRRGKVHLQVVINPENIV